MTQITDVHSSQYLVLADRRWSLIIWYIMSDGSLAPDCSRLQFSPNKQSGKYMDPILTGTAVSGVSCTDFIALVLSQQTFVGRERAQ